MQVYLQLFASVFSLLVGLLSFRFKSVSFSGLIALVIISHLFILLNMLVPLCIIFLMFASSSIISKFKKGLKKDFLLVNEKNGPRDYIQALANLGVGTICIVAYKLFQDDIFLFAFICSVAAANADSWATEIGGLSKQNPLLISSFKPVPKGVSGGVTWLGIFGGLLGSAFIVLAHYCMASLYTFTFSVNFYFVAVIIGFFGMLIDSLLGVKFQVLYKTSSGRLVEYNDPLNKKYKGYSYIDNDMVNGLATLITAILGLVIYSFM